MGSFVLNPGAELAWENNDNIFYRNNTEISDNIVHVRPWLNLNSDWNRHALNLTAYADIGKYRDFDSQDYEDWVVSLDGRVDVKRGSAFNYKASYLQLHEDRSSTDSSGIEPAKFTFSGFDVAYKHGFNRLSAMLGYNLQDTDYDNNIDFAGDLIDNQDRDRSRDTVTLRADYAYSEKSALFFSYAANHLDYDQRFDNNGFRRSSDGSDIRGGIAWDMTGVIVGDFYLNYVEQKYDDPRFKKVDGFGIGADLEWTPTDLTSVSIRFANTPQETTQAGTSGYYSSLYSARVQHELRRNILINARFSYTDNQYEVSDPGATSLNGTEVIRAGLGMSYLFNRNFYLSGGYIYEKQDANTAEFKYTTNRLFMTLGLEF
jgi:hypothetical protein